MGVAMRRPYQGQGDKRDLRGPPEPDDRTNQFRNALGATRSERRAQDDVVRFGVLPEPPPRDRKVFAVLSLLGLVLVVAAVSAYVGMTFMPRWLAAMEDTPPGGLGGPGPRPPSQRGRARQRRSSRRSNQLFRPHRRSRQPRCKLGARA